MSQTLVNYFIGWGKSLGYCIAFSVDGAIDVTGRYVRSSRYANRRHRCSEAELLYIMDEIRKVRRSKIDKQQKFRLEGEDMKEQRELRGLVLSGITSELCELRVEALAGNPANTCATKTPERERIEAGK